MILRLFLTLFSFFIFVSEFLTKSSHHKFYLKYFSDKDLHFLSFFLFPLFVYILLRKYKVICFFISVIILSMTYFIEVLQSYTTYRTFSLLDFKYSLSGFLCYLLLVLFLKALSYTSKVFE